MPLKTTAEIFRYGTTQSGIDEDQTDRIESLENQIITKVNKAGDTMTGNLVLGGSSRLGVGTTSPAEAIDVNGNAVVSNDLTAGRISGNTNANLISCFQSQGVAGSGPFQGSVNESLYYRMVSDGISSFINRISAGFSLQGFDTLSSNPRTTLHIKVNQGSMGNDEGRIPNLTVMSLNNLGNVGIGTTTPAEVLHINKPAQVDRAVILAETGSFGANTAVLTLRSNFNNPSRRGQIVNFIDNNTSQGTVVWSIGKPYQSANFQIARNTAINNVDGAFTSGGQIVITIDPSGNVGIGTTTPTEKLNVVGNIEATGSITGDTKNFKISHPNPAKTETHHLYHTSIEAPTAGTCHYEYKCYVEHTKVIELPSYFKYLIDSNSVKCHITPIGNMVMFCYNIIDDSHIEIKTSSPTNVAVLITGVRKDCGAMRNWKGAEVKKPPKPEPLEQQETNEIYTGITEDIEPNENEEEEVTQQEQEEEHLI